MANIPFPDLQQHHIAFSVRDLNEAVEFWRDTFGFELEFQTEIPPIGAKLVFIRRGGIRIELFEVTGSAETPSERRKPNIDLQTQGTKHIGFSVRDPQAALEILFERDVPIVGVMRGPKTGMVAEDDPRLGANDPRPPAFAFFLRNRPGRLSKYCASPISANEYAAGRQDRGCHRRRVGHRRGLRQEICPARRNGDCGGSEPGVLGHPEIRAAVRWN